MRYINKKLTILATCIISSYSMANFVIVVDERYNNYEVGKFKEVVVLGNWTNVGNADCTVDIENSEIYYNRDFNQTEICTQEQERKKETYLEDHNGNRAPEPIKTEKESQTITVSSNTTIQKGTHIENNCEAILTNNYSDGDGLYRVGFNNSDVYCDMTRNGGGWMRITNYDFDENPNNTPQGMVKTINRTLTTYTGASYRLNDGWYRKDVTSIPANGYSYLEIESNPNGFNWKQTMIEINSLQEITPDSYNVANSSIDSTSVNGQYLDGISFTYGNAGSRKHIHSLTRNLSNISRAGLEWLVSSGDYTGTETVPGNQIDMIILSDVISPTSEKISARLMLNQLFNDEKIGFTKYNVWIK